MRCPHPLVESIFATRTLPLAGGGTTPLDIFIPREEGDFLYRLVRENRPACTVEIGMANGISTLFMAAALAENGSGRHIAIDPFQTSDWKNVGLGLVRQAGLGDYVRLVELPSHQALPDLEREGIQAELIFIDGAHLTDYVFADFLVSDKLLAVGGLAVFDDSDWPAVHTVMRYALANRDFEVAHPVVVIEPPPGWPSLAGKALRSLAGNLKYEHLLRGEVIQTAKQLGIEGRCVALRKRADDDRNSQDRHAHHAF
ncbi:MAG: class I SAM-dependent methyltransferase [Pirellulaceae bacterium]